MSAFASPKLRSAAKSERVSSADGRQQGNGAGALVKCLPQALLSAAVRLARRILGAAGLAVVKSPTVPEIRDLLRQIWPVKTDFELIRVGGPEDGGYLVPNDFVGIRECLSPGVGSSTAFEDELAQRGIECHLADGTLTTAPILTAPTHRFVGKNAGIDDSLSTIGVESWVRQRAHKDDLLLQMDIEGAEYEILNSITLDSLLRFRILVIEFHGLNNLFTLFGFRQINSVLSRLCTHFHVVHIHPNNSVAQRVVQGISCPPVAEITFLRKDRSEAHGFCFEFPHRLDSPNTSGKDTPLPHDWFSPSEGASSS